MMMMNIMVMMMEEESRTETYPDSSQE